MRITGVEKNTCFMRTLSFDVINSGICDVFQLD
jgi:hypothetical protein